MTYPLVEIAIPVYNGAQHIVECIESVLAQTYPNVKLIISDNCSTDDTLALLSRYSDSRITVFKQSENLGVHGNFNFLITKTTANFVKLLCADDVLMPWAIERQIAMLRTYPGTVVCSSDMIVTDENLKPTSYAGYLRGLFPRQFLIDKATDTLSNIGGGPSNVLFDGDALRRCELNSSYRYISDLVLIIEVCKFGFYINEGFPSYLYRRHSGSDTNLNCDASVQAEDWAKLLFDYESVNLESLMRARSRDLSILTRDKLDLLIATFSIKERLETRLKVFARSVARSLLSAYSRN